MTIHQNLQKTFRFLASACFKARSKRPDLQQFGQTSYWNPTVTTIHILPIALSTHLSMLSTHAFSRHETRIVTWFRQEEVRVGRGTSATKTGLVRPSPASHFPRPCTLILPCSWNLSQIWRCTPRLRMTSYRKY